jgi:precorrin isomerase
LEAAAAGDFVISLYNPRSAGRSWQLEAARRLLLDHREPGTPVGLVTDAYRSGQRVELTTLGDLDPTRAGMTSIVVIGSSRTRMIAGRMVTPRGYPPAGRPEIAPDPGPPQATSSGSEGGRARRLPAPGPAWRDRRGVHPIESESYRIVRSLTDLRGLGPLSRAVAERVVHASGDPAYAGDLVLDEAALEAGLAALNAGAPVVVDARMVAAAITGRETRCALDLAPPVAASPATAAGRPPVAASPATAAGRPPVAASPPTAVAALAMQETRAAAGVRVAAREVGSGAVWVVGCAPTALAALLGLDARPALVIGLPVGFVGAVEAKRALAGSALPAVTNRSVKGGSAVAAAALNALLYWEGAT